MSVSSADLRRRAALPHAARRPAPAALAGPTALALLAAAVTARALAPLVGVATDATAPTTPATVVGVLVPLAVLAVAATAARRRADLAPALVLGIAALAPGALLADLPLLTAPESAARPELLRPAGLAAPSPAAGAVLVLVADVLLLAAAGAAAFARTTRRDTAPPPPVGSWTALLAALPAALGVVLAPFAAPSGLLDPLAALDQPGPAGAGAGLIALAVLAVAFAAPHLPDGRAVLVGLAAALVAVGLPVLVAGATTPGLGPTAGPVLVLVGAVALAATAAGSRRPAVGTGSTDRTRPAATGRRARTPGAVGVLAAVATAAAAAAGPVLTASPGTALPATADGAGALLLPAAVLLGVPALVALVGRARLVVRLRPALGVAWLGVLVAAGPVLDVVLAGLDAGSGAGALGAGGAGFGTGGDTGTGTAADVGATAGTVAVGAAGWLAVGAVAAAVATGLAALCAGAAERREVAPRRPAGGPGEPDRAMLRPAAAAAVLAVPGLGGPLAVDAFGGVGGGPWQDPGVASWTALAGLVGVVVAVLLAPRARPPRALALLGGAAAVVLVRLSALVLAPSAAGAAPGVGTWAAASCLVALAGAIAVAATRVARARRAGVSRDSPGVATASGRRR